MLKLARALTVALGALAALTSTASAQNDADLKEIASYRLTAAGLKKYEAVVDYLAAWAKTSPEVQTRVKLMAGIDSLRKKDELSDKEQERLDAMEAQIAKMDEADDDEDSGDNQSIAAMEKRIMSYKPARDALGKAGMTAHEYALFTFATITSGAYSAMKKQGMSSAIPKDANAANMAFVDQNADAITAVNARMEKLSKAIKGAVKKG